MKTDEITDDNQKENLKTDKELSKYKKINLIMIKN